MSPQGEPVTYQQLLDRIISDGIAAARIDYADKPDMLRGSVEGFEACRAKSPSDLVALYQSAEQRAHAAARDGAADYWSHRSFALELEWVLNVVSVGVVQQGGAPLLGWLPTARGVMKFAEIVGVHGHGVEA
jgi:hypothetical protein